MSVCSLALILFRIQKCINETIKNLYEMQRNITPYKYFHRLLQLPYRFLFLQKIRVRMCYCWAAICNIHDKYDYSRKRFIFMHKFLYSLYVEQKEDLIIFTTITDTFIQNLSILLEIFDTLLVSFQVFCVEKSKYIWKTWCMVFIPLLFVYVDILLSLKARGTVAALKCTLVLQSFATKIQCSMYKLTYSFFLYFFVFVYYV